MEAFKVTALPAWALSFLREKFPFGFHVHKYSFLVANSIFLYLNDPSFGHFKYNESYFSRQIL